MLPACSRPITHGEEIGAISCGSCVPAAATIQGGTYSGTAAGSAGNLLLVGSVSIRPVKWKYPCRLLRNYRRASRLKEAAVVRMPSAYGVPEKPNSLANLLESKRYGLSLWYSIS